MRWKEINKSIRVRTAIERLRLTVRGRVQGVGFRPSVFRFAAEAGVTGTVRNTNSGVIIEIEGEPGAIDHFGTSLTEHPPPLARLDSVDIEIVEPVGDREFVILESEESGDSDTIFPVDAAVCGDCLAEMRDPRDRRYRYPFINCTNCGPRFTIIEGLPYDRPLTTMSDFEMDAHCRGEYTDPSDRRFHAEPVSCPGCGPKLLLIDDRGEAIDDDPIDGARKIIAAGGILAVKGLGGYHLACLATDGKAVDLLRQRKRRPVKPFALMFRDLETVREFCVVGEREARLLVSSEAPIVILRKSGGGLPENIAPGNGYLGAFLPYTPVHHLLIDGLDLLIMTSANFSDEPLISTEDELEDILGSIADAALINDRKIAHKCDDSIFFVPSGAAVPIRRARGYVPEPIRLPQLVSRSILGTGGQEKGTFTLTRAEMAFVSSHLGDLGDLRGQLNYRAEFESFTRILGIKPEIAVCDMHPDYFTTRFASELGYPTVIKVQHHHAHAVSVMVEHGIDEPVIGVSFDGTGYGTDGKLWGGEFILARHHDFTRLAHLGYIPLPGGAAAVREPWRMALMYLRCLYGCDLLDRAGEFLPLERLPAREILQMAERGINSIETSSIGRLFDAVASLLNCGHRVSYEAEAAVRLEELALNAGTTERHYTFDTTSGDPVRIDPSPVIKGIIEDLRGGKSRQEIAAVFHNSVARLVVDLSYNLCKKTQCGKVVLSGGVFQNRYLCERISRLADGIPPVFYQHRIVPPNDGGISLGQVQAGVAKIIKGMI
ncbi:MAG: carbamoyltransferase HypF [Candidatus Krumholzibacteriota bacterium]|nr:carbamoyltransferase HypF [Candidatus Krumholzibacteriota bacterium]